MLLNLKIGKKLALGFGIVLILTAIISAVSIFVMNMMSVNTTETFATRVEQLKDLDGINEAFERSRANANLAVAARDDDEARAAAISHYESAVSDVKEHIGNYLNFFSSWEGSTADDKLIVANCAATMDPYLDNVLAKAIALLKEGRDEEALGMLTDPENAKLSEAASSAVAELFIHNIDQAIAADNVNTDDANRAILVVTIAAVLSVLFGIFLALAITKAITTPISGLTNTLSKVAAGDLNVTASSNARDEVGVLTNSVGQVIGTINTLIHDIEKLSENLKAGEIDAKVDAAKFQGAYKEVAEGVNDAVGGLVGDSLNFIQCLNEFSNGNFEANIPKLPGKKFVMNQTRDNLSSNLGGVASDIKMLVSNASDGKLDIKIDENKYRGDWQAIVVSLNGLMNAIQMPIDDSAQALVHLSRGDLKFRMTGDYHGKFGEIKKSVNDTMDAVGSYINEISTILDKMAHDSNLKQEITREYVGDFNDIKQSINLIASSLSKVMNNILSASDQVLSGSKLIADSSMALAQGATEQASAVEELNASIETINEQTLRSAKNADEANNFSLRSRENALKGNEEMKKMLVSMESIKSSSDNISKINKVIEDIAFQTNLLALNAAVEAARAGDHGKGFAVVADEVRNLAARSQNASKETTILIDESMNKVDEGTQIARATAVSLETIVSDFTKVSEIISGIAESAKDQAGSVQQISIGIGQISQVVQSNSSTSEEAAATAEELSSQSETLKQMIAVFKTQK